MTRTSMQDHNCSLARCIDIIGDKWTLLLIRDAFFGASSFSQFQRSLNIARNVLSNRLDTLVERDIFEKVQTKPNTERYTYHLTERGLALMQILLSIAQWGDEWISGKGCEPVQFIDNKLGQPIRKMKPVSADGRELNITEILATPGPGADQRIHNALNPSPAPTSDLGRKTQ